MNESFFTKDVPSCSISWLLALGNR